jgi:tetratricopeptide (TPR) repeat protein
VARYPFLPVVPALAIVAVLMASAAGLQFVREERYPPPPPAEEVLYVTSGNAARRLAVGYRALAADLYWIRAIQHYGGTKRANDALRTRGGAGEPSPYPLLYPLLDLTTSLDPQFNIAYRFGAIFLAEPAPWGPGRPDLAVKLLQKGLAARPGKWEYMWDVGFVYYRSRDYRTAAEWFQRASEAPDGPWWLRSMAAVTLAEGGDRGSSRRIWETIRETAEIDWLRVEGERRLQQLAALDGIDTLQAVVDRVAAASGRRPTDWNVLITARALRGVPTDPTGMPYVLDSEGRVRVSTTSQLYPLPEEPQAAVQP